MTRRHRVTGVVVIALAAWSALAAVGRAEEVPGGSATPVEKREAARRDALIAADPKALESVFAENCTYIHSNGMAQSRNDLVAMLARGEIRYVAFTIEDVEYRTYGNTIVGTGTQTIELTNSGKPFVSRSRYTVVYAPVAGGLKVVAYQATPLPEVVKEERKN